MFFDLWINLFPSPIHAPACTAGVSFLQINTSKNVNLVDGDLCALESIYGLSLQVVNKAFPTLSPVRLHSYIRPSVDITVRATL